MLDLSTIKSRRAKATPKITLMELSRACGVAFSIICNIERGLVENPGLRTVEKIFAGLDKLERERAEGHADGHRRARTGTDEVAGAGRGEAAA